MTKEVQPQSVNPILPRPIIPQSLSEKMAIQQRLTKALSAEARTGDHFESRKTPKDKLERKKVIEKREMPSQRAIQFAQAIYAGPDPEISFEDPMKDEAENYWKDEQQQEIKPYNTRTTEVPTEYQPSKVILDLFIEDQNKGIYSQKVMYQVAETGWKDKIAEDDYSEDSRP